MSENKITIAVVGVNGALGKDLLKTLTEDRYSKYFNHPIRALTRDVSKAPTGVANVEFYTAPFDDAEALKKALSGVDTLIDISTPHVSKRPLVDAAVDSGIKLFIPSEFGCVHHDDINYPLHFKNKKDTSDYSRSQGLKTVLVQTAKFADWDLAKPFLSGIVPDKNLYRKINGGTAKFSVTFISDICRSVAELIKLNPRDIPDEVIIESDQATTNEIAGLWEKYNNLSLTVVPVTKEEIHKEAEEASAKADGGGFVGFVSTVLALINDGGLDHSKNNNELVNPGQKNFQWTTIKDNAKKFMTAEVSPF